MRKVLEFSLLLVIIAVLGYFGVGAMEKSILDARKKVLLNQLHKISRHLQIFYSEKNRLPDVANLMKGIGLSVCQKNQNPIKGCVELKRVVIGNKRKYWSLSNENGTIYFDSKTGESIAVVEGKRRQNVAKVTFSTSSGLPTLTYAGN